MSQSQDQKWLEPEKIVSGRSPSWFPWGRRLDGQTWAAAGVLVAGTAAIYHRTSAVPFLLDDEPSIVHNATIRRLWPLWNVLHPPPHAGVGGRPLLNLSLAWDYQCGGATVAAFHRTNLLIHVLAACLLFGLVRRTLGVGALAARFGTVATPLALAASALWAWHPLQTESVTYLSQRAESLAGLFYLLTLYCFARGAAAGPGAARAFFAGSVLACLAGIATKEVVATAPLAALLYDRAFLSGSFAAAWARRRAVFCALAATWLPLAGLMADLRQRDVGFGLGVSGGTYALTECRVMLHYLQLALWPHPLVFDYGPTPYGPPGPLVAPAAVLALLAGVTLVVALRRPALGFAPAWFFLLLAPTSSFIPVAGQPMAESRLYLPLAGLVAFTVVGLYDRFGRRSFFGFAVLAVALGLAAAGRNRDYLSAEGLWRSTLARVPGNPRAHDNLGYLLAAAGRLDEAVAEYQTALRLQPNDAEAHNDLGDALLKRPGRGEAALAEFQAAVRLKPDFALARYNLGTVLAQSPDRRDQAQRQFEAAIRLDPSLAPAHYDLGLLLQGQPGQSGAALREYEAALQLEPAFAEAHENRGNLLAAAGRPDEAAAEFQAAVRLEPQAAAAHYNLANVLKAMPGRRGEAIAEYREALRLDPAHAAAHNNLGNALRADGRVEAAIGEYEQAVALQPDFAGARLNLALALLQNPARRAEAVAQLRVVLQLQPDNLAARQALAAAERQP